MTRTASLRIDDDQRRQRLVRRHLLAVREPRTAEAVTGALVALHATDPATVHLSAAVRGALPLQHAVDDALYERRSLVRVLAMRRTMFVVSERDAGTVHAAAGRDVAARERAKLLRWLTDAGIGGTDPAGFVRDLEDATLDALAGMGSAYGRDLGAVVPGLQQKIRHPDGEATLATRILLLLSAEGRIVRGRPRGVWTSTQYSWQLPPHHPPGEDELPTAEARVRLVRAYLRAFGPATAADVQWWAGWTAGQTKQALAALQPVPVQLEDESTGYVLEDDTGCDTETADPPAEPGVALLPALDPTVMGWTGRGFYLDPALRDHTRPDALFDRSGNPGPTVWWDGRIVGGWAQQPGGEIATRLLHTVPAGAAAAIAAAADELAAGLGPLRVTPRFRTPLERALAAGTA